MKLPKTLYAKIADGGTGPDYVSAEPDLSMLIEMGERVEFGVYELVGTRIAEGTVTTTQKPKRAKR